VNETHHRVADDAMLIYRVETQLLLITRETAVDLHSVGYGMLVKNKRRSDFSTSENCQGQLTAAVSNSTSY
jgi:hypothetical protein